MHVKKASWRARVKLLFVSQSHCYGNATVIESGRTGLYRSVVVSPSISSQHSRKTLPVTPIEYPFTSTITRREIDQPSPSLRCISKLLMKGKDLSDVQNHPPRRADRSQTLDWGEIIAYTGSQRTRRATHGITLGRTGSTHQPGWSLWLL